MLSNGDNKFRKLMGMLFKNVNVINYNFTCVNMWACIRRDQDKR